MEKSFQEYHKLIYIEKTVNFMDRILRVTLEPVDFQPNEKLWESDIKIKFSNKLEGL